MTGNLGKPQWGKIISLLSGDLAEFEASICGILDCSNNSHLHWSSASSSPAPPRDSLRTHRGRLGFLQAAYRGILIRGLRVAVVLR